MHIPLQIFRTLSDKGPFKNINMQISRVYDPLPPSDYAFICFAQPPHPLSYAYESNLLEDCQMSKDMPVIIWKYIYIIKDNNIYL